MRPILKYHGGKWRMAPWIISHMPHHRVYVEPFCGAASVLIRKNRATVEVLNDLYGRIVNVFRILRDPIAAQELKYKIKLTPFSNQEYLEARTQSDDPMEDARKMLILGHQGFGSSGSSGGKLSAWRRGTQYDRNRSYADQWADIYTHIDSWTSRLRRVFVENMPAQEVIDRWDDDDALFYVDPPYVAVTRHGPGNEGYAHELSDQEHIDLAEQLHKVKGTVMISGYNCDLYDDLYKDWQKFERDALAEAQKKTVECLWISPAGTENFQLKGDQ